MFEQKIRRSHLTGFVATIWMVFLSISSRGDDEDDSVINSLCNRQTKMII